MSIRESINKRPGIVVAVAILALIAAVAFSLHSTQHKAWPDPITQAFYSNDDGKSYFVDALGKPFPFDHDGSPACRAYVYRCGNSGNPFVGYLARQTGRDNSPIPSASTGDAVHAGAQRAVSSGGVEVKRPGDQNWVPLESAEGTAIVDVNCPDGGRPLAVLPGG